MKSIIVVATDEEYKLAQKRFKGHRIIQTGVGGINVVRRLKRLPKWLKITNFGYVGSNKLPVGTEVDVRMSRLYHPGVQYIEPWFTLNGLNGHHLGNSVVCFTSNNFVTETKIQEPVVFDMELAFIMALGFKRVKSIKIVSDNLSLKEYEKNI